MTFNLAGQYTSFISDIGVDDETEGGGSVVFQVFADNNLIFDSGVLLGTSPVQLVDLNVTGVSQLRLVVTGGTDGVDFDHADWANARLLSVPPEPPAAPSGLTPSVISGAEIRLTWTDNATNETGFQIERSANGTSGWTQIGTVGSNVTAFNNSGLTPSTTYFYRLRSINGGGTSAYSNVVSETTTAQTITYLSDLPFVGTPTNGWGPVERDRSNGEQGATDGGPIRIRGNTYTKGLGVHSASVVTFNLPARTRPSCPTSASTMKRTALARSYSRWLPTGSRFIPAAQLRAPAPCSRSTSTLPVSANCSFASMRRPTAHHSTTPTGRMRGCCRARRRHLPRHRVLRPRRFQPLKFDSTGSTTRITKPAF